MRLTACQRGPESLLLRPSSRRPNMAVPHMEKQKPVHTVRLGRIKATIWANESMNGTWYSVQVCRIYKEGDERKQSDSFGRDDLLLACKVLDQAHTWIYQQAHFGRSGDETNGVAGTVVVEEGHDLAV